ncbi:type II secretion system F family protein [Candidatus Kuenenbacteria bacterium]|nr:type II secretion system F family protein [Candidatus Kuenenbacteria bacterium]
MAITISQFSDNKKNEVSEDKKDKKFFDFLKKFRSIGLREKIFFVQNLRIMVKGGLSLGAALDTVAAQVSNSYFKEILGNVSHEVDSGVSFSQALEKYPKVFNDLFVNMIKSGEMSGNLEGVLERLHIQMKRDHDLIAKVKGAMVYPLVVVVAMVGIGTAMIVFVVPKLIAIFEEFKAKLPLPTRILIGVSKFITANGVYVVLGLIIFVFIFIKFYRSERGKNIFHKIFLKIPVFSTIVKKINLARFCRTTSSLLKTDIPIVQSLKITSLIASNVYYKMALVDASQKIAKGLQINKVLSGYPKLFPPTVIQMLKVGEESGAVDEVLDEVAQFYEEDINQVMESLPSLIEPILILVLGFGVGGMAIAIIMPMYSLTQSF